MIVGVGIDQVDIARIARLLHENGARFQARVFTAAEIAYCGSRAHAAASFAARFCAKEAALKCLRTGQAEGLTLRQVEVLRAASGAVDLALHGAAAARAAALGVRRWHVSLTHTDTTAAAVVLAEA